MSRKGQVTSMMVESELVTFLTFYFPFIASKWFEKAWDFADVMESAGGVFS